MSVGRVRCLALGAIAMLAATGCAGARVRGGVFESDKGYRVSLPSAEWTVASDTRADLELRHRDGRAGMLVNASCGRQHARASLRVLARHLLSGVRDRSVLTREDVSVNGKAARHAIVEGRLGGAGTPVKLELYVVRDDRCLYDFVYAAPPESFETWRPDFERLLRTFTTEE